MVILVFFLFPPRRKIYILTLFSLSLSFSFFFTLYWILLIDRSVNCRYSVRGGCRRSRAFRPDKAVTSSRVSRRQHLAKSAFHGHVYNARVTWRGTLALISFSMVDSIVHVSPWFHYPMLTRVFTLSTSLTSPQEHVMYRRSSGLNRTISVINWVV